nr:TetR/AcrR family transcriptional regulator [Polymorphobacter sp.]
MSKSDQRRSAIIDALADHVLAHGLPAASLRPLAKAAAISDRMLLYYFKDKAEVMAAVLERVALRLTLLMEAMGARTPQPVATLHAELLRVLLTDELWPFMCVWLEIAALSARGDPLYRAIGEAIGRGFLAWGAAQLDSPAETRDADALRLLTMIEGAVVLKSLGIVSPAATR